MIQTGILSSWPLLRVSSFPNEPNKNLDQAPIKKISHGALIKIGATFVAITRSPHRLSYAVHLL